MSLCYCIVCGQTEDIDNMEMYIGEESEELGYKGIVLAHKDCANMRRGQNKGYLAEQT